MHRVDQFVGMGQSTMLEFQVSVLVDRHIQRFQFADLVSEYVHARSPVFGCL